MLAAPVIAAEAGALLVVRRVDERIRDALVLEPTAAVELAVEDVLAKQDVGMYALRDL